MKILTYHKVEDAVNFEKQLRFLKKFGFNVISLDEFRKKLTHQSFNSKDVLITFDDGEYSVYKNAMPLLKKYNYPSVMFIVTDLIGTDTPYWWDEIKYYTKNPDDVRRMKKVKNEERLKYLGELRSSGNQERFKQRQLTLEELKEMEANGMAIANHSSSHPMLDQVSPADLEKELSKSFDHLKKEGFQHHDVIAYPNGNVSEEVVKCIEKIGYKVGMLFNHDVCESVSSPFRISRLSVNDHSPYWKYMLILFNIHPRILKLRKALKI